MTNRTLPLGIAIIAAGIVIMLGKMGVFQTLGAWLWPLLPLASGLALLWAAWNRRLPGAVFVPGAVLTGLSFVFLLCAWFGWDWMKAVWPIIPLSAAAGLYQFAMQDRISVLRTVSIVVGGISVLLFTLTLLFQLNGYVAALLLIVIGILVIARGPKLR
jgi:hypothetical protein